MKLLDCPFCGAVPVKSKHSDMVRCPVCCVVDQESGSVKHNVWIPVSVWQERVEQEYYYSAFI